MLAKMAMMSFMSLSTPGTFSMRTYSGRWRRTYCKAPIRVGAVVPSNGVSCKLSMSKHGSFADFKNFLTIVNTYCVAAFASWFIRERSLQEKPKKRNETSGTSWCLPLTQSCAVSEPMVVMSLKIKFAICCRFKKSALRLSHSHKKLHCMFGTSGLHRRKADSNAWIAWSPKPDPLHMLPKRTMPSDERLCNAPKALAKMARSSSQMAMDVNLAIMARTSVPSRSRPASGTTAQGLVELWWPRRERFADDMLREGRASVCARVFESLEGCLQQSRHLRRKQHQLGIFSWVQRLLSCAAKILLASAWAAWGA